MAASVASISTTALEVLKFLLCDWDANDASSQQVLLNLYYLELADEAVQDLHLKK